MTLTANFILVCTWLSLAVAVVAHQPNAAPRALGHHAHANNVKLSHLPVVSAVVDDATGKIETTALQKKKRALAGKVASKRYYGDERGFSRPGPLPAKRALILPTGWSSLGCVTEGQSFRALKDFAYASSTMTVESCLEVCKGQGFSLGGLEWSNECYCSNSWSGGGGKATDDSNCNMPCVGSSDANCGGYFVLSAYTYTAPSSSTLLTTAQCAALTNSTVSALLPSGSAIASPSATFSPILINGSSSAYPSGASSAWYSGASSAAYSSRASSVRPSGASSAYPSGASSAWFSGASSAFPSSATASASASASGFLGANFTSLAPTGTVTGSASLPTTSAGVISTEWEALGCYLDNPAVNGGNNILRGTKLTGDVGMTQTMCQTRCAVQGYNFAGLEYGDECWCGDLTPSDLSSLKSNAPYCNMPCTGDASSTCGGGWSLQLFEQVDVTGDSC